MLSRVLHALKMNVVATVAATVTICSLASAQSTDDAISSPFDLEIHGFVSQGFLLTTDNNYLAESERGSFEFAEAGINFTKSLTDDLRLGVQLFARDLGPVGNYAAKFDWFYLDYRFRDWLGLRAGRVKLPFGLYNEINDVDSARVPILLPSSVYPAQNRDALLAQTGVELYGRISLAAAGVLEYRIYGGTIFLDVQPLADASVTDLNIPYIAGGRLLWETPLTGLRVGASVQSLRLDADLHYEGSALDLLRMVYTFPDSFLGDIALDSRILLWVSSLEYATGDLLVAAEYSRWHSDVDTNFDVPELEVEVVSERAYVLASYRVNAWLHPGLYYSLFFPSVDKRSGRADKQHDIAASVRFDLNAYWLVKLEAHYMIGTAGLELALNDRVFNDRLVARWGLFLAKTTAYF